jgi:hypothetical protein
MFYNTDTTVYERQKAPNSQGAFNNALAQAQAAADPRFNMKSMDRSGVSRGRGTAGIAGIQAAQNLADGVAEAYRAQAQSAATDAENILQYEADRENFGQGVSNIAMQNDYANALAALQRNQNIMQFQGNALGGLLGNAGNLGNSFGKYNGTYRF